MDESFEEIVEDLVRARAPLIVVKTLEEERALDAIEKLTARLGWGCVAFDVAEGFYALNGDLKIASAVKDPLSALEHVDKADAKNLSLYLFKDFDEFWGNAQVKRKLRNVVQRLKYTKKSLVVTCPTARLPEQLRDEAEVVEFRLPGVSELSSVLAKLERTPGVEVESAGQDRERLVQAALGLTALQAQRAFGQAIISDGKVDEHAIRSVMRLKKRVIAESRALQFYEVSETLDDVGGLQCLKEWVRQRGGAFSQEARDFGLPFPKGLLLVGISGTGKSLTAKMVARQWKVPLLRLDVGSLFGSLVGESETNMRQALRLAETVSPCVLWIDELEKAMARGGLDGGTSERVFGTILTWMAEKTAPCFVVATANDISRLPPELLRKGRFDEVFFLDLPNQAERKEIFAVHLKKRGRNPSEFNLDVLAQAANGYVGAEIEQAIIDALFLVYNEAKRDLKTDDIVNAIKATVPLSVSQHEIIENLQQWLRDGRARAASATDATDNSDQSSAKTTPIDIRPKDSNGKKRTDPPEGPP